MSLSIGDEFTVHVEGNVRGFERCNTKGSRF
jgi:hypothetical protein